VGHGLGHGPAARLALLTGQRHTNPRQRALQHQTPTPARAMGDVDKVADKCSFADLGEDLVAKVRGFPLDLPRWWCSRWLQEDDDNQSIPLSHDPQTLCRVIRAMRATLVRARRT
jgi:hypothetical protein